MRPPDVKPPDDGWLNPITQPEVFMDAWESGFNFGTTMSASAVRLLLEGNPRARTNSYQYWRNWGTIAAIGLREVMKDAKSEERRA